MNKKLIKKFAWIYYCVILSFLVVGSFFNTVLVIGVVFFAEYHDVNSAPFIFLSVTQFMTLFLLMYIYSKVIDKNFSKKQKKKDSGDFFE